MRLRTCPIVTAQKSMADETNFTVYSNPFNESITVSSGAGLKSTASLYNVLGEKVYVWKISNQKEVLSTTGLNPGIYILQIQSGNNTSMKKLVKE